VFRTIGSTVPALNVVNRHFQPLLKCAGLRDIRWHDLRHTCATLLHDLGFRQLSPLYRSCSVDVSISTMKLN
jgi:integrase